MILNKNVLYLMANQNGHLSKIFIGKNVAEVTSDGEERAILE